MPNAAAGRRAWAWPVLAAGLLVLASVPATPRGEFDGARLAAAGAVSALALLLLGVGLAALVRAPLAATLGAAAPRPPVRAGEALAYCFGLLALSALLDRAIALLGLRDASRLAWLDALFAELSGAELVLVLGGVGLAPAVAEELVFRGLLLGALRRRAGAVVAVVGSAFAFGAVHFDLAQSLAAGFLGLYLGALVVATGSVRPAILAHAVNNTVAIVGPSLDAPGLRSPGVAITVAAVLAVGFAVALVLLRRRIQAVPPPVG